MKKKFFLCLRLDIDKIELNGVFLLIVNLDIVIFVCDLVFVFMEIVILINVINKNFWFIYIMLVLLKLIFIYWV